MSCQLDMGSDGSVLVCADLIKDTVQHKCTSRCSAFAFFFVFDFARSPTDAKPPDAYCLRALRVPATRPPESTTAGHLAGSGRLARCHARLRHLVSSPLVLRSPLASVQVVLSQHGHRLYTSCPVALLVLRPDKSFWLLNPRCHCVQYVLSCLTVFRRCFSAH